MHYGTKVNGRLEPHFIETADLTNAKEVYQIDIETSGIVDEAGAIDQLLTLEEQFPDLRVVYIETDRNTNTIHLQFADAGPGQFSFTGLLAAMPAILAVVFIAVLAFTLWTVYASNPILLWALLALGAGVAFFYLTSTQIKMPTTPIYGRKPTPKPTPSVEYREEAMAERQRERLAEQRRRDAEKRIEDLEDERKRKERELKSAKEKKQTKPVLQKVKIIEDEIADIREDEDKAKDRLKSLH